MAAIQDLEKRNKVLERRWKIVLIIAVVFVVTRPVALYIVNNFIDKAAKDASRNEYPLIDPARQLIPQKYFLTTIQPLREKLNELVAEQTRAGDIAITLYLEDLNTGSNISINPQTRVFPASLTKLPVVIVAMNKIAQGKWTEKTELALSERDKDSRSGSLYKLPEGSKFTIIDLIKLSLEQSDNTAHDMLLRNLEGDELQEYWSAIGLDDVFNEQGELSAKEYSRILRSLYTASFLDREHSSQILKYLAESKFNEYLSAALPANIQFAHKYGRSAEKYVYSDAGIIYLPDHPYLITVLTGGKNQDAEATAKEFMSQVGKESYLFFSQAVK